MNATVSYIDKAAALRETAEQQLFYVIGNSVGISYYIKRHCVPESAVRGEEYIAVLSAHAPKCASSAHFVLDRMHRTAVFLGDYAVGELL